MTGTYTIWLSPDLKPCDLTRRKWSAFVGTCRKLAAANAHYQVSWELGAPQPHVVVRASAPTPKPSPAPRPARRALPAPLTPEECQKRAAAAQRGLLANLEAFARQVGQWRKAPDGLGFCRKLYSYDSPREARCRALGQALRVIHARRAILGSLAYRSPDLADYQALDLALGTKVPRASKLSGHACERGYYPTIVRRFTGGTLDGRDNRRDLPEPDPPDPLAGERWYKLALAPKPLLRQIQEARAEVEFWGECERLARERRSATPVSCETPTTRQDLQADCGDSSLVETPCDLPSAAGA